jgi:hypothetical protein
MSPEPCSDPFSTRVEALRGNALAEGVERTSAMARTSRVASTADRSNHVIALMNAVRSSSVEELQRAYVGARQNRLVARFRVMIIAAVSLGIR